MKDGQGQNPRHKILAATADIMREKGVAGATARAICARVGITAPTLYHYFGDLRTLHEEVVDRSFSAAFERGTSALQRTRTLEDVREAMDDFLRFAEEEPAMFSLLVSRMLGGRLPPASAEAQLLLEDVYSSPGIKARLRHSAEESAQITAAVAIGAALMKIAGMRELAAMDGLAETLSDMLLTHLVCGEGESGPD